MLARYGDGPTIPSVVVAGNKGRGMTIVSLLGISPTSVVADEARNQFVDHPRNAAV
jgi:hypothetical protein